MQNTIIKNVVQTINAKLKENNIGLNVFEDDFYFFPVSGDNDLVFDHNPISGNVRETKRLSEAIVNHIFPPLAQETVYHYTSKQNAIKIVENKELWMFWIKKRIDEQEIIHAAKRMHFKKPVNIQELAETTFYTSFIGTDISQSQNLAMWDYFGKNFEGVRLKLQIKAPTSLVGNFREMKYLSDSMPDPIDIVGDLIGSLQNKHGINLVINGAARMACFGLPMKEFSHENERRLILKSYNASDKRRENIIIGTENHQYIRLPFHNNDLDTEISAISYASKQKIALLDEEKLKYEGAEMIV